MRTASETENSYAKETSSDYFKNANKLVKDMHTHHDEKPECAHDVALVLKTIANTEEHPDPDEIGGIDLKALYSTLSLLAMGYPVEELNDLTHLFLAECVDVSSLDFL